MYTRVREGAATVYCSAPELQQVVASLEAENVPLSKRSSNIIIIIIRNNNVYIHNVTFKALHKLYAKVWLRGPCIGRRRRRRQSQL